MSRTGRVQAIYVQADRDNHRGFTWANRCIGAVQKSHTQGIKTDTRKTGWKAEQGEHNNLAPTLGKGTANIHMRECRQSHAGVTHTHRLMRLVHGGEGLDSDGE